METDIVLFNGKKKMYIHNVVTGKDGRKDAIEVVIGGKYKIKEKKGGINNYW